MTPALQFVFLALYLGNGLLGTNISLSYSVAYFLVYYEAITVVIIQ